MQRLSGGCSCYFLLHDPQATLHAGQYSLSGRLNAPSTMPHQRQAVRRPARPRLCGSVLPQCCARLYLHQAVELLAGTMLCQSLHAAGSAVLAPVHGCSMLYTCTKLYQCCTATVLCQALPAPSCESACCTMLCQSLSTTSCTRCHIHKFMQAAMCAPSHQICSSTSGYLGPSTSSLPISGYMQSCSTAPGVQSCGLSKCMRL